MRCNLLICEGNSVSCRAPAGIFPTSVFVSFPTACEVMPAFFIFSVVM